MLRCCSGGPTGLERLIPSCSLKSGATLWMSGAVDAKLDALLKQAGIEFDPFEHVQKEVIDALKSGNKIEAVRLYKESSNVSLKEAKENVEEVQRRTGLGG